MADPALDGPALDDPSLSGAVLDDPALAGTVPSPYFDLGVCPVDGLSTAARDRAAVHTGAAERLARLGRWEQAYDHLRAAVRLLQGHDEPGDELARLRREHAEARELSRRDSLTATYNRRYLDECLATLLDQPLDPAVRTLGLSVALVDIDHFKQVNDRFGHAGGDEVLVAVAAVLAREAGGDLFRFGGEEFAVLLPGATAEDALREAERLRRAVAEGDAERAGRVTVSIGVAALRRGDTCDTWLNRADAALYEAKRLGRDRVARAEDALQPA